MANFCTNCGNKLGKDDNFCSNCGTKTDINHPSDSLEKGRAKKELKRVVGRRLSHNNAFSNELLENGLDITNTRKAIIQQVEKEIDSGQIKIGGVEFRVNQLIVEYKAKKEEENRKLKIIDEIFKSEEIKSEIRKNNIDPIRLISIKDSIKDKLINKTENMSDGEVKNFIKTELQKSGKKQEKARTTNVKSRIPKEKENRSKKIEENEMSYGGYCSLNCRHCYEEIIDSGGGITADYSEEMCGVDYYCELGHPISYGSFCEDYE